MGYQCIVSEQCTSGVRSISGCATYLYLYDVVDSYLLLSLPLFNQWEGHMNNSSPNTHTCG